MIREEKLDPDKVVIWMDWFSIDQVDSAKKSQGIESMLHYTTQCDYMLIPLATDGPADENGEYVYYPEAWNPNPNPNSNPNPKL